MDLNKTPWKILLMVILFCAGTANADADPEASPDPEPLPVPEPEPAPAPEPEPQADAEPMSVVRNRWGGQNTCEMTNTCCDMATSNCCQSGQKKCYTVWERKCDTQDKPECSVRSERHCHNIQLRECRDVTDVEYRNFNTSECVPKPLQHCFEYEKKICNAQPITQTETIYYTDQRLIQMADNVKRHCIDQKSFNCTTRVYSENIPQQVKRSRTVTDMQRRCRMVQKRTPDQEITIPVTRVTYKTMCYNVPRSVCSQDSCSGGASTGTCGQDTTACSTTDFSTRTICPEPLTGFGGVAPGLGSMSVRPSGGGGFSGRPPYGGCQQVQSPVCTDSSLCNSPNLQCCSVQNQQVCKQVPQRIVEQVKQVMPGQVTWQEECQNYPVERQEWYVETVNNYVNRTKQDCQPVTTPSCHSYLVPTSSVVNEQKSENVNVNLRNCQISTITERYCHTFSDGDAECRETTVRKGFRITKKVCDQTVNKQECVNLPVTDCRMGTTANCQMVPRQVCQDTCSDSPMCKQCDDFRNGPGFGSCRTSTCGNYYPNDPVILPGTGGQGFYPGGIGGEGGYFPGGVGGEGQYPGSVGGEGSFSGGVGGEGYFPGGGDGYFQGGIGGENFYPGDQGEDDLFQGGDSARPPYWSGQGGAVQPFNVAPAVPREALD